MKLSWIKRYALYDSDSNLIDVSDRIQTDKCEKYGGYITIEDTHEICYRSKAYMKEAIEETLTEYGVAFTDALADRLIKEIYYECDQYLSEFKEKFIRILKTKESGDYIDDLDYVSIKEVNEAFDLAGIELSKESKESKTFKD